LLTSTHVEGALNYAFDEGKDAGSVSIADEGYFRKARKLLHSTTKSSLRRFPMPLARRVDWSAWARGNATGLQARLEFGDSLQGLFSQGAPFTSDFGLARALDVWYATVEGGDELLQMTELARSIRSTNLLVAGHHPSSWPLTS